MIRAYDEQYLTDAEDNLGEAFDYAVNRCGLGIDEFMDLFIGCGLSESFGKGNPSLVSGRSGTELAIDVIERSGVNRSFPEPQTEYDYSPEYWCGWILAYYQWSSGMPFKEIRNAVSMKELCALYNPLHEAGEEKAADTINALVTERKTTAKLQLLRKNCGFSQKQLAEKSGVNLRTLQQYELRTKDIAKASFKSVLALADVLGCRPEELLDFPSM